MPEGPEVKRYVDYLNERYQNSTWKKVEIVSGRYTKKKPDNYDDFVAKLPAKLDKVKCKGKFIYYQFDNGYYLWSTLGMTGRWWHTEYDHLRFKISTSKGSLYYDDQRNFGTLKFSKSKEELNKKLNQLGPDILYDMTTLKEFTQAIKKVRNQEKTIAEVLMEQKIVSGVGNYARAEALWYAKISPHRTLESLKDKDFATLFHACRVILYTNYNVRYGLKHKLISKKDIWMDIDYETYGDMKSNKPNYGKKFYVYEQEKDFYGKKVKKEKMGSRSIHWTPGWQK